MTRGALLAVFCASAAHAQLVDESFESGGLDAGGWVLQSPIAGITVSVSSAAAHRGQYGLRMQDTEILTKQHSGTYVSRSVGQLTPAVYSRLWVRFGPWDGGNGINIFDVLSIRGASYGATYADALDAQGNLLLIAQPVDDGGAVGYATQPSSDDLADGAWHLVEGFAWGIDTANMSTVAYFDGADAGRLDGLSDFPDTAPLTAVGEVYASGGGTGNFTGSVDFDDIRVNDSPLPSRLSMTTSASPRSGDCFSVTAELLATAPFPDGGPAGPLPAPYDISVNLGGGSFYFEGACRQPIATSTTFGAGTVALPLFVQAGAPGPLALSLHQVAPADFLPGTLTVTVAALPDAGSPPDAGTDSGPPSSVDGGASDAGIAEDRSLYALNCGCGSSRSGAGLEALLLGALALLRAGAGSARRDPGA
jgi:hypothetical protein